MRIIEHRLHQDDGSPYPFVQSPNTSGRFSGNNLQYLVMHYTAGTSSTSAVKTLTNPNVKASAHIVVGRDGKITQMVPFNTVAWHAGTSTWRGLSGLNKYSIGIEITNAGLLEKSADGKYYAWYGEEIPASQVTEAPHKNAPGVKRAWHRYTDKQIEVVLKLAELLVTQYGLKEIIGHDDIAPRRKTDPGPAFPLAKFNSLLNPGGRKDPETLDNVYRTVVSLNLRTAPSLESSLSPFAPLPKGTRFQIVDEDGAWKYITVLDTLKGSDDVEGWISGNPKYMEPSPS
jgi:N-acetylmuramoyl-L-alanine amidase